MVALVLQMVARWLLCQVGCIIGEYVVATLTQLVARVLPVACNAVAGACLDAARWLLGCC